MQEKRKRLRMPMILVLLVLLLATFVGSSMGRYLTRTTFSGQAVFKAELAEKVELLEHKASNIGGLGQYQLGSDVVTTNTYDAVMPGVDIPKDPYVVITGKSPISAYLFIEVKNEFPEDCGVTVTLLEDWLALTDATGPEGTSVYVYTGGTGNALVIDHMTPDLNKISILKEDKLNVGEMVQLEKDQVYCLNFNVCLGEVVSGKKPAEIYQIAMSQP